MSEYDKPSFRSDSFNEMNDACVKTQEVWGGVRSLRKSNYKYLVQFEKESEEEYKARKDNAEFYPVFGGTVDTVVGMVCTNEIAPVNAPKQIQELFSDFDLCGNDFASFIRDTFTNATRDGHSFIFVDAPPPVDVGDRQATAADVAGRRPFCINYKKNQAINWRFKKIDGKSVLSQITFKECTKEQKGRFGEEEVIRYRVLNRGSFSLYREPSKEEKQAGKNDLVEEIKDRKTGLTEIPLVTVYSSKKTNPLESDPPFYDLLEMNLVHYNKSSKKSKALDYVVPMPVIVVDSKEDADDIKKSGMTFASQRGIIIYGQNASASYLELKGDSLPQLTLEIEGLEKRMAKAGVEKFAPTEEGNKTAYEVGSDNKKELSQVSIMAKNLENACEQVFYFIAEYLNAIGSAKVSLSEAEKSKLKLNINYDRLIFSIEQMQLFDTLREKGVLSNQTFLELLQQIVNMPKGFSVEEEAKRLAGEKAIEKPTLEMAVKE
jgi:hypothetical protein